MKPIAIFLLSLLGVALFAQDVTFKSETKLVILDVTARDKSGRPVMTLAGARHAARVGVSLLARAGLAEMIADSEDAFIKAAAALAEDEGKRRDLRSGMRDRLEASLLRDEKTFADSFAAALEELWARACARGAA